MVTTKYPFLKWTLSSEDREHLLALFVPHFPIVLGLHLEDRDTGEGEGSMAEGVIVGQAEGPAGFQCLIVSTRGTIYSSDGRMKMIMWSLSRRCLFSPSNPPTITHWDPLPFSVPIRLRLERTWRVHARC